MNIDSKLKIFALAVMASVKSEMAQANGNQRLSREELAVKQAQVHSP